MNRNIGLLRLGTGAVVNCPVADDHIKVPLMCGGRWLRPKHGEDNRQERTEPKDILFHGRLTVTNMAIDAKWLREYLAPTQNVPLISPAPATARGVAFESYSE